MKRCSVKKDIFRCGVPSVIETAVVVVVVFAVTDVTNVVDVSTTMFTSLVLSIKASPFQQ